MTTEAVIATSDPRASHAGADVFRDGGNAVDAAVTAAFALLVLEPHACGVGGDAFLLLQRRGEVPVALDGSGAVPARLAAAGASDSYEPVPRTGPRTLTVPGAVDLLAHALASHGTIDLDRATAPARAWAREGFSVRATLAAAVANTAALLAADPVLSGLYLPGGRPVAVDQTVRNERLAVALDALAADGARCFYEGAVAEAIAARSAEAGGYLDLDDLRAHRTMAMTPISTSFAGGEVWELPPPTQGRAVLTALARLADRDAYDDDAVIEAVTAGLLVTGLDLRRPGSVAGPPGDTTYVAAVDGDGLGASLITSVFTEFGSVVGVEAIGGPLQNRAAGITAVGRRPSPGKPPHTTIPALVTRHGQLEAVLGVVGGYMQAQGQVQVLVNLLVRGMDPQTAVDAPRLRVLPGGEVALEPGHALAARWPEAVGREPGSGGFGGAQVVQWRDGRLSGGSDHRKGGAVVRVPITRGGAP